jgi:hypothetical protein
MLKNLMEQITRILKKLKTSAYTLVAVLLIAAVAAGCTLTGAKNAAEIVPLTADEVAQYNKTFEQILYDAKGNPGLNPLCPFLTSYYDKPEDMNLLEFLRYFPSEKDVTDQTEFEALKAHDNWSFGPKATLDTMPVPIHRIPAVSVNDAMKKYAGITLKDLSGVGTKGVKYLKQYDAYYTFTSDFGPGFFSCTRGEKQGDIVRLYGETATLTLKIKGGGFLFVSRREPDGAAMITPETTETESPSASAPVSVTATAPSAMTQVPAPAAQQNIDQLKALFTASTGNINDYMPDLLAGKGVSAYRLLPCLENFTHNTWLELEKAYSTGWWNALWTALEQAA